MQSLKEKASRVNAREAVLEKGAYGPVVRLKRETSFEENWKSIGTTPPENGWLEYWMLVSFGEGLFSGAMLVSGRVPGIVIDRFRRLEMINLRYQSKKVQQKIDG